MDRDDEFMAEFLAPLPAEPAPPPEPPPPEAVPMEKTELVDLAGASGEKKTYLDGGEEPAFKKRQKEGFSMAPPVDVYEPGFRSDLYAAIKSYFKKQKETRERVQQIREKTGIGRHLTWTP